MIRLVMYIALSVNSPPAAFGLTTPTFITLDDCESFFTSPKGKDLAVDLVVGILHANPGARLDVHHSCKLINRA
jgi:hypothetical protein